MNISDLTLKLILLFFPGLICAYIVDILTVRPKIDRFFFVLQALIFGFASYFTYWLFLYALRWQRPQVTFLRALVDGGVTVSYSEIAWVCFVAVLLGLAVTCISTYTLHLRLARRCKLTKKTGPFDIWDFTFNSVGTEWATVRDHRHDLMYDGWVEAFSDDSRDAELLLRDVDVYRNSTQERLYQVGAMYITLPRDDVAIEFRAIPIHEDRKWKEASHESG